MFGCSKIQPTRRITAMERRNERKQRVGKMSGDMCA